MRWQSTWIKKIKGGAICCPLYMTHELYQRPLPPKLDDNYMARADEIREHAKQSLQAYLSDADYRYLLRHKDSLSPRLKKELCTENVLGCVRGLKTALEQDNLVAMWLHERADFYLDSFKDCADKVRLALAGEVPNLFELAAEKENDAPDMGLTIQ